ncbi:protein trichome birefringence-like 19 [Ipomoea triloba]|uniref:protein trichome birefringence-like 19 n=1 Tax=Ipomoea triloba TaxID=35885 RepID=UPI00125DB56D|nr:protein trichome birefringence-like 19 [Ipomoea triloba]
MKKASLAAEVPNGKIRAFETFRNIILPILTTLILIAFSVSSYSTSNSLLQSFTFSSNNASTSMGIERRCDIFKGNWVPYPEGPYYTNKSKCVIEDRQNCMKFGRPDSEFMKWRWQPDECDLPMFDAGRFLEVVRGKTLAFVGDSVARNQMQSLVCLLASVADPVDVSYVTNTKFRRWLYKDYNFTIQALWSPHLVKSRDVDPNGTSANSLMSLYLDEPDSAWADHVQEADIVIISAAQWFFRPFLYHKRGRLIGCHKCTQTNTTKLTNFFGYRMAFRTAFKTLSRIAKPRGLVILRTFSPSHFENGDWDKGGNCVRTKPFVKSEVKVEGYVLEMYLIQIQEFRAAQRRRGTVKLRLLDTTEAMILRPDGHPNHYGHWAYQNITVADCVHWCLPGPVDTWNQLLLQILKTEEDELKHLLNHN